MSDIQFHFIGNMADNFKPYWQSLLADQPANVVLWYERSDCDAFYAAMDAFLFTSVGELFPLAVKEALSWQMPVFMRDLEVYCRAYDHEEGVTLITEDVEDAVAKIRERFPVEVSMSAGLKQSYSLASHKEA
jgi:glycosyltransferase involved in cell wall biosynthesis